MRRLALLFTALVAGNVYADGPLQSSRFFQNNGGLIDHISPLRVPDNAATEIENVTLDDRGQLSKRNGYTVIQSTFALGRSTWVVTGGVYHTASTGSNFFAVVVGTDVYRIGTTFTTYSRVTGGAVITALPTNLAQSTSLQDRVIFCNEVDKPFYLDASNNALQISTNTFTAAKTCATYGSYLVAANTTESAISFPSRVRWSDINDINSFPVLNYIDVEPDDGDKIVGVIAFDESVYIFKHRSIYRMLITGLDGPDAFIIRPVSRNIGAWAKQSLKVIPNVGIAFLAQNTAYLLNGDGITPIGDPIQRTFDNVQRSMWASAVGEVYPRRYQYWLSVSTGGSTNNEILVYDYIQHNWTTYTGINASMLAQSEDSTGQNILISGDYAATTYKQDTGSLDHPVGVTRAITASYTTANLLMGTYSSNSNAYIGLPDITKQFKYIYIYTLGDQNYTLNVQAAYDFSTNFEYNQDIQVGSSGAVYDMGVYDTDIYPASGFNVTRLELNHVARSIKLQFSNSNSSEIFGLIGWTVVYSLQDYRE